ncbi:MAG: non-canonical purine NTP pyrophosphatase [Candidatus Nanoarchaeia archaeon]|jgi:XTP/dITP diphosphohydrolase
MTVYYVTSGDQKFKEIKDLIPTNLVVKQLSTYYPEEQDMDLRVICSFGAKWLANQIGKKVIVDDMGLFIKSLNGLPGPFTKFFAKGIKPSGVLKLMEGINDRRASFKVCLGYCEPRSEPITFIAERKGIISNNVITGPYDYGFNSIFIPQGTSKCLAELTFEEKIKDEPRRKAFKELIKMIKE